jgi:hypothetical protein
VAESTRRLWLQLGVWIIAVIISMGIVLGCYGWVIRAEAQSLLRDLTALRPGKSTEADAQHFFEKHKALCSNRTCEHDYCVTSFEVKNGWLASLRLEPYAEFYVSYTVEHGQVSGVRAILDRSMPIYPTFSASAGIVEEYAEYPSYLAGRLKHYSFPTPIGKPYLNVRLDSHATRLQRQRAFGFSFRCFVKPGWGCNLPCDYLPAAWQDWKAELHDTGFPMDYFNKSYPNNDRCRP